MPRTPLQVRIAGRVLREEVAARLYKAARADLAPGRGTDAVQLWNAINAADFRAKGLTPRPSRAPLMTAERLDQLLAADAEWAAAAPRKAVA